MPLARPRDAGGHLAAGPHVRLPPRCTDPAGGTSQGGGGSSRRELHPHQLRGCSRRRLGRPSPQSVPELHSLAPRASAETAGRQGHPELDVTKPSLGPSRRGLLPPWPSAAPASAMAPGMSGRRGAALLCLSALLAHGKCCGADSGVKMRRSPLEGHRGYWRKANPHAGLAAAPPSLASQAAARVTSIPQALWRERRMRAPPWGPSPAQEKGGGGGGESLHVSGLERRVQTRVSGGVSAHRNL